MELFCLLHGIVGFVLGILTALIIVIIDDVRVVSRMHGGDTSSDEDSGDPKQD